ncbi:MAG: YggS family pyridoxal phosphate-dependent enzyme [Anaerolineae bacterium]|nr:YggS family pyridoxal phosphate-dependent enzyme [Anaerolineae bacterium]NUQ02696.1 YggS family pyridoxal phosphate-dependent enzyme [Anaerolineae bacterium]
MTIAENLERVQENIRAACARVGRSPDAVTLIAVSKTHSSDHLLEAASAGAQHFGENRVEESVAKIPVVDARLTHPVTWHMIGHIQSRKAKDVAALFRWIHSIDSVKLAEKLSRNAVESGLVLDILLEMNVSGEASKGGFDAADWQAQAERREMLARTVGELTVLPGLRLRGVMTMAPIVQDVEETRPIFASLAALREWLAPYAGPTFTELSMGMTDDYPVAVQEGATMVRVGRAIFGERTG